MCFGSFGQNVVYSGSGETRKISGEDLDIVLTASAIDIPKAIPGQQNEAAGLLALIPTAVDFAFKLTTKMLENRVKKFTAEYSKQKSYLDAGKMKIPDFEFVRKVKFGAGQPEDALRFRFKAHPVEGVSAIVYYVDSYQLQYSSALTQRNSRMFDYTIEIKITYIDPKKESKTIDVKPLVLSALPFASTTFEALKHRTDFIIIPDGSIVSNVALKIVETNPYKVRAEKIVGVWNEYKDSAKTIINNYLPKAEEKESGSGSSGSGGAQQGQASGGNAGTGNTPPQTSGKNKTTGN